MNSIVIQLKLLFERFFGDDVIIGNISDSEVIFDEKTNKNITVIFFDITGYPEQLDYDMSIESNFAPLLKQIIESLKFIDPKLYLECDFTQYDSICLALCSEEPSGTVFEYESDDE